jgi:hypothetical protein
MGSALDIKILLTIVKDVLTSLSGRLDKKKDSIVGAHKTINAAFIKTYDYLRNRNGEYLPNLELADAWNEASASIMRIDEGLADQLYSKSRFWLDPALYRNVNRESEIIELNQIVDEMERLRIKLYRNPNK